MRPRRRRLAALALTALAAACPALLRAETLYVIEYVVVGVNTEPDGTGERIASIRSGDRVEVLERQDQQARVRLGSGLEGWVRASYLTAEPPLRQRLAERSRELESARQEIGRLQAELASARAAANAPPQSMSSLAGTETLEAEGQPLFPASDDPQRESHTWLWVAGSSALALALGFALGWRVLDRRIWRKYGGLRIY